MRPKHLTARMLRRLLRVVDPHPGSLGPRTCPICDYTGSFSAFGVVPRPDARCPSCGSLERHRLLKLLLDRQPVLPDNCRLLHFAPEESIAQFVKPLCSEYVTTDLMRDDVDLRLDIEALDLEDSRLDALICSHVLEHVDDAKALPELYRILRPGGVAILAVPIVDGWDATYEDPEITNETGRLLHFGQRDHLRRYGRDFRDRVQRAGFTVEEFVSDGRDAVTYSLIPGDRVFLAQKPSRERAV